MTNVEAIHLTGPLADRGSWQPDACPAAAALTVVGTRSALLIVREALYGTTRFDEFVSRVGITESVTAARLRELTAAGVLARVPYQDPGSRTRYEYRLTEAGAELAPVIFALYEWGARHATSRRAPIEFTHRGCGSPVHADIVCDDGHRVELAEIDGSLHRR